MNGRQIIFQSDHVTAIAQDRPSDTVFVTFNEFGTTVKGDHFWGDGFFEKLGIAAVGIVTPRPNWYPPEDMGRAIDCIRQIVGSRRVVTYGQSQGGYGALKYSGALGASAALAFSPQWSIVPSDVRDFDQRYIGYHQPALNNGTRITQADTCDASYIFYDDLDVRDRRNAERLLQNPKVTRVLVPFTGHNSVRLIAEGRVAGEFILQFENADRVKLSAMRSIIRRGRPLSQTYAQTSILRLLRSGPRHAGYVARMIASLPQSRQSLFRAIERAMMGHAEEAEIALAETLATDVPAWLAVDVVWAMLREYRLSAGELILARVFTAMYPNQLLPRLLAVDSFVKAGDLEIAQLELERLSNALDVLPKFGKFRELAVRLGRIDLIERFLASPAAASDKLPLGRRIEFGLEIAKAYESAKRNLSASRQLIALTPLCRDRPADLQRVADQLFHLGTYAEALAIRIDLAAAAPEDIMRALDVIEARIGVDKRAAAMELKTLESGTAGTIAFWEKVSLLHERINPRFRTEDAMAATRKALALGADPAESHMRLARLHARCDQPRLARREMEVLLDLDDVATKPLGAMVQLAIDCEDMALAIRLARKRHQIDPAEPEAALGLADLVTQQRRQPDQARMLLDGVWNRVRAGTEMPAPLWIKLAELYARIGDLPHERTVIETALVAHPTDTALQQRRSMLNFFGARAVQRSPARPAGVFGRLRTALRG